MNIFAATRAFETWLSRQTRVVPRDLRLKHEKMAVDPFVFLRATFYRWLQLWPKVCADLVVGPRIASVGDLHIENFGTWRDLEGRLIWGVNDLDEACVLPFAHDLVRLAASARLAIRVQEFTLSPKMACEAILEGYRKGLTAGGRAMVLGEGHGWLRRIALKELEDPREFWAEIEALPVSSARVPRTILHAALPKGARVVRIAPRVAGAGSLGRERFVALAELGGAYIAREAKALVPSAAAWLEGAEVPSGARLFQKAVRQHDPFFSTTAKWTVRRISPDCTKIDVADLPDRRDEWRLLRAMGWETANLHLATKGARLERALDRLPARWLERSSAAMADVVIDEWRAWRKR